MKKNMLLLASLILFASAGVYAQNQPSDLALEVVTTTRIGDKPANLSSKESLQWDLEMMNQKVAIAVDKFSKAGGNTEERMADLTVLEISIKEALVPLQPGGALLESVDKNMKQTELLQKKYAAKAIQTGLSSKLRIKYTDLAKRYEKNIDRAWDNKGILDQSRNKLEERLVELSQNKEFIADLMQAEETELALDEFEGIIEGVQDIAKTIGGMVDQIGEGGQTTTPKE
jgi:hypothetical protein